VAPDLVRSLQVGEAVAIQAGRGAHVAVASPSGRPSSDLMSAVERQDPGVVIVPMSLWRDRGAGLKLRTSANPEAKTSLLFQFAKTAA
jgi:hypothetical protein